MVNEAVADDRALRVLVVDDNADAADSLCTLLRLWGYDAHVAYDGTTGLEVASALLPDCLFLDIGLPGVDGYDLAQRLRAHPALMLTEVLKVASETQKIAEQSARMARETKHLIGEAREDMKELKGELREVKGELREVKDELREVKDIIGKERPEGDA